jgi:hypothetical protein
MFSSTKVCLKDNSRDDSTIIISNKAFFYIMSINRNKRDLSKRDQALNDSTSGQLGEEPCVEHKGHSFLIYRRRSPQKGI